MRIKSEGDVQAKPSKINDFLDLKMKEAFAFKYGYFWLPFFIFTFRAEILWLYSVGRLVIDEELNKLKAVDNTQLSQGLLLLKMNNSLALTNAFSNLILCFTAEKTYVMSYIEWIEYFLQHVITTG